jgi:hypothetical protein
VESARRISGVTAPTKGSFSKAARAWGSVPEVSAASGFRRHTISAPDWRACPIRMLCAREKPTFLREMVVYGRLKPLSRSAVESIDALSQILISEGGRPAASTDSTHGTIVSLLLYVTI